MDKITDTSVLHNLLLSQRIENHVRKELEKEFEVRRKEFKIKQKEFEKKEFDNKQTSVLVIYHPVYNRSEYHEIVPTVEYIAYDEEPDDLDNPMLLVYKHHYWDCPSEERVILFDINRKHWNNGDIEDLFCDYLHKQKYEDIPDIEQLVTPIAKIINIPLFYYVYRPDDISDIV